MINLTILVLAGCLLAGLLAAEKNERRGRILAFKTPLSILFVVAVVLQPHPLPSYYHLLLVGLVLGLIGDVSLALPGERAFMVGLVSFLAGHILYVIAFTILTRPSDWMSLGHLVILGISAGIFFRLRPYLGKMLVPVVLYIIVITVMLGAALAASRNPQVNAVAAWVLFLGALCFYLSDLFVARDRFIVHRFINRLVGLPLYYCGQFLLAFSVGLIG
ncbi:MAG: lysoplasmalogenase [Deltaproteobacteria bacterium]